MENFKNLFSEQTKKYMIPAGAITMALLTSAFTYKVLKGNNPEYGGVD